MSQIDTGRLAVELGARLEGDPHVVLSGVAAIGDAGPGDLSFVANPKYIADLVRCRAAALIVGDDVETGFRPVLRISEPYLAFVEAIKLILGDAAHPAVGVHPTVVRGRDVRLGAGVTIYPHVILEDDVEVGDGTVIYPSVFVGSGSRIGRGCVVYHRVILASGTLVGAGVILHSGTVLGGLPVRGEPGRVIIEDDVELGANVTVDADPGQITRIGAGTKMDNLVMVGSGAVVGRNVIVVSQAGLGAGCEIGDGATIAGKSLVSPGVKVGAGATLAGRTFATEDIPAHAVVSGSPARPHKEVGRMLAHLSRLPDLANRIHKLEEKK